MNNAVRPARIRSAFLSLLATLAMVLGFVVPVAASTVVAAPAAADEPYDFRVLVFYETAGFQHGAIPLGNTMIQNLGVANDFEVVLSNDSSVFDPSNAAVLDGFDAVVFNSTTGDVLDADQQTTLEAYLAGGGGFAGIHAASDTEHGWEFYKELVGGEFTSHPANQTATIKVQDHVNESTKHLEGDTWTRLDEWYNFASVNPDKVHVLLSLDETSYTGGTMGAEHPISWCQDSEDYRSWYTGLGHTDASYSEPAFQQHVLGGIQIAAGVVASGCSATQSANYEMVTLDDNTQNPMAMDIASDGTVFYIERNGRLQQIDPVTRATTTAMSLPVTQANEDGLLGVVLDPDFATNGWVYLYWAPNDVGSDGPHNRISRFTYDFATKTASPATEAALLKVTTQRNTCCHAGGDMLFDNDGNLILATGDNTNPFESDGYTPIDERAGRQDYDAQRSSANTNDLRGKVIRITPTAAGGYTIPTGNLFDEAADSTSKTRPEIYAMGFRNPFRIGLDPETGNILVADYGPDAGADSATRGPRGSVEWNLLTQPGNYGWPYCAGGGCYRDFNFDTNVSGATFSNTAPINNSPNNTGLTTLPPVIAPDVWYTGATNPLFPEIGGGGAPMGGPVYRYDADLDSDVKWPEYWDGKAFFGEWNQGKMYSFQLDEETGEEIVDINRILPGIFDGGTTWHRSMDFEFGPDGALYVIDWGSDFGGSTADSGVYRVDYVQGSPSPIARASADVTNGPTAPLTVQFSSEGTRHPLALDYTLSWNFGDGTPASTEENPSHTYTAAGSYNAQLTVTDEVGKTAVANVQIVVGNALPTVSIDFPENGGFFEWGDQVRYEVTITDPDATEAIDCQNVRVLPALGHDSHNHDFGELHGCEGSIQTIRDAGHGLEANLFWVINVSYTDDGGVAGVPLTGFGTNVLNPKLMQSEYFDTTGQIGNATAEGVRRETTQDTAGGGQNIGFIDANDFWSYEPVNLVGIDAISLRIASGAGTGGGDIQARWGTDPATAEVIGQLHYTPTIVGGTPQWQVYDDFEMVLDTDRPTGTGTLFFVNTAGGANINYMEFIGDGVESNDAPTGELVVDVDNGLTPLTVNAVVNNAVDPDGDTAALTYQWDSHQGAGFQAGDASEQFVFTNPGTFDLTVRITDEGGAYTEYEHTITVVDPIGSVCLAGRSDGFDWTSLDTTRWTENVRTNQFLEVTDGELVIPAERFDLHNAGTGTPNLVLQELPDGAFSATTRLTFASQVQYQQAGLILYGDDNNYVKLVLMNRGGTPGTSDRVIQFLKEDNASAEELNSSGLGSGYPETVYLRVVSDAAGVLTAYYSADGADYTAFADTWDLSGIDDPKLGLFTQGSTSAPAATAPIVDARFDWFYVTPDDTVPASTPNDEFDGDALDYCRWSVVNEDSAGYRVQDGNLQIDTSPFDIYGGDSGVTNFIVQDQPEGDWTVETKVDGSAFDRQYQQGGLIVYTDDANYLKLDILSTNTPGNPTARNLEMRNEIGGVVQEPAPNATAPASGIVWLRIVKTGTSYTGFSSADGTTWTQVGTAAFTNAALDNARVGLYALGNSMQGSVFHTAQFDYFHVIQDEPLTVSATVAPAAPNGADGWYTQSVTVTLETEGGTTALDYREYKLDDGVWLEYTTPVVVSTDGEHTLQYRASELGGESTGVDDVEFKIDATLPTASATLGTDRLVTITGADAGSGLDTIQYRLPGDDVDTWRTYTAPFAAGDAATTVTYRSTDNAGNAATSQDLAVPAVGGPVDPELPEPDRISGVDRYDTAVQISEASYPGTAPVVYIATGLNYPDALSAGPASALQGGPLLLVNPTAIPESVRAEIVRLDPAKIVVVGGSTNVSEAVYGQLEALTDTIERIAGPSRYETSRLIVSSAFGAAGSDLVYIATGANFPDALSAGGAAGSQDAPVLLIDGGAAHLEQATKDLLVSLGVDTIKIVGGEGTISTTLENELAVIATTERLAGADRYSTAQVINADAYDTAALALVATGLNFPDALAGSAWAGTVGAPLYVVPTNCVPQGALDGMIDLGVTEILLIGGTGTLGTGVENLTPCP